MPDPISPTDANTARPTVIVGGAIHGSVPSSGSTDSKGSTPSASSLGSSLHDAGSADFPEGLPQYGGRVHQGVLTVGTTHREVYRGRKISFSAEALPAGSVAPSPGSQSTSSKSHGAPSPTGEAFEAAAGIDRESVSPTPSPSHIASQRTTAPRSVSAPPHAKGPSLS